jgi:hypothetical protein
MVCALEPRECSTLFNKGFGAHRIEGIGDKMVTLIHNVLTTDYLALIHDNDCLLGLDLLQNRQAFLERLLNMREGSLDGLHDLFGISGICNIIGSIRMARFLNLSGEDNVVTVATDGFDRYPSVLADLETRRGPLTDSELGQCFEGVFRGGEAREVLDIGPQEQKRRLFGYKEELWTTFGYSASYLESMTSMAFWEEEFDKIQEIDATLVRARRF